MTRGVVGSGGGEQSFGGSVVADAQCDHASVDDAVLVHRQSAQEKTRRQGSCAGGQGEEGTSVDGRSGRLRGLRGILERLRGIAE